MYNVHRLRKWKALSIVFTIFFAIIVLMGRNRIESAVNEMFEIEKCPVCYGLTACDYARKLKLNLYDFATILSYFFGIKNVFFGTFNDRKIVIKKLGSNTELKSLDEEAVKWSYYLYLQRNNTGESMTYIYKNIKQQINLDYKKDHLSRLRLCPTTQRLNILLQNVYSNNHNVRQDILALNIWTLVFLNPEPLLLQILPAENGWPVPKYLGACGRVIIEQYVGSPLTAYYHASWQLRMKIAVSLLHAAHMFTFADKNFAFYLTDISADNIAINQNGDAKFVDLENIIVVDKSIIPKDKLYTSHNYNGNLDHTNHIIFSVEDICNHKISDHNFYSICQLLLGPNTTDSSLSEGLLRNLPLDILQQYSDVEYLIKQCNAPEPPFTRIVAGNKLKQVLETILAKL